MQNQTDMCNNLIIYHDITDSEGKFQLIEEKGPFEEYHNPHFRKNIPFPMLTHAGLSPAMTHQLGVRSYDEDALPPIGSPGTQRITSPPRLNLSVGPSISNTPKIESVPVVITSWFNSVMNRRRVHSSIAIASTSSLIFIFSTILLQSSVLHPIQFVRNVFSTLLSIHFLLSLIASASLIFLTQLFMMSNLSTPTQLHRLSLRDSSNWSSSLSIALTFLVNTAMIVRNAGVEQNGFSIFLLYPSVFIGTLYSIFWSDHQLSFAQNSPQLGTLHCIQSMFSTSSESVLMSSLRRAATVYRNAYGIGLLFGLPFFGTLALWSVVDISLHLSTLSLLFYSIFTLKAANKLIRHFVMKPISFPLPPPFAVHSPNEQQMRTLNNVLECTDPLLRLFAFFDLRRISWSDKQRRLEIFSLSQPGGHPRNWTSVCTACVGMIEQIRSVLQMSASQYSGLLTEEDEPDREMLMMPSTMRNQIYSTAVRNRVLRPRVRPSSLVQQTPTKVVGIIPAHWYKKLFGWTEDEHLVVSRYDSNMTVLAIESLYTLCVESFDEDRYGVVQRDLATVISLILSTIKTIDQYFRARNARSTTEQEDVPIRQIDNALQTAVYRLNAKFGNHLQALNLTTEEIELIKMLS